MKLTVLGGGGFRAPILAKSLALGAKNAGIDEVALHDIDETRLNCYGALAEELAHRIAPQMRLTRTTDARTALTDSDYVITTIRPGAEEGRAFDERCCLDCGVLGQETTGAGGYAMALRSIPAIAGYCALAKEAASPDVQILNFTNPSGLVTQAMRDLGYDNVYGVCDAPTTLFHQLADMLGIPRGTVFARSYGLNHLSWFDEVTVDGRDAMAQILAHPALYEKTDMGLFGADLLRQCGNVLPNEYFYFWYFQRQSLASVKAAEKARGETIAEINAQMLAELKTMDIAADFDAAFRCYMKYLALREGSYFAIETGHKQRRADVLTAAEFIARPDGGGYAGVALDFIRARESGVPANMVLSVPNNGTIAELADSDVVEISCRVERSGLTVIPAPKLPPEKANLLRTVKQYETLAVQSILENKPELAVKALMIHPLVADCGAAKTLVERFSRAYG